MKNNLKLNEQELLFFKHYTTGDTKGNAVQSAIKCGIKNYNTASKFGAKMKKDPRLKQYKQEIMDEIEKTYKIDIVSDFYMIMAKLCQSILENETKECLEEIRMYMYFLNIKDKESKAYTSIYQQKTGMDSMTIEQIEKEMKEITEELKNYK